MPSDQAHDRKDTLNPMMEQNFPKMQSSSSTRRSVPLISQSEGKQTQQERSLAEKAFREYYGYSSDDSIDENDVFVYPLVCHSLTHIIGRSRLSHTIILTLLFTDSIFFTMLFTFLS